MLVKDENYILKLRNQKSIFMFNFLQSNYELFLISIYTFLIILTIRHFIKNKYLIILCHAVTFLTFFVMSIGGGSAENDAYKRYEEFVLLEQDKQLENAKKILTNLIQCFKLILCSSKIQLNLKNIY